MPPMAKATFSKFRSRWWEFCKIERQLKHGRTCSAKSLAEELEVDVRTVRRYIEFMRDEMGAPIAFDRARQSYALTDASWSTPNVHLTLRELEALAMAVKALTPTVPAPFSDQLDGLLAKLLDALPEEHRREVREAQRHVDFVPGPVLSTGHQWVEPMLQAIRDRLTVEMTYYTMSRDEESRRKIDPYHLRHYGGTWYTVGYCHRSKQFRVFNVARIRALALTDDIYTLRAFDAKAYFKGSWGVIVGGTLKEVRIKLTGWTAKSAGERQWPEGFSYAPSGAAEGILSGRVNNLFELELWVASCQGDAEILPPA